MSFIGYVTEVTFVITLYLFSEYIMMPMIIQAISVTLTQTWRHYLKILKMSSTTSLFKEDVVPLPRRKVLPWSQLH